MLGTYFDEGYVPPAGVRHKVGICKPERKRIDLKPTKEITSRHTVGLEECGVNDPAARNGVSAQEEQ